MTREELREKAIEKLKSVTDENGVFKAFSEVSSLYSLYLNDCVSPATDLELPFIVSSMNIVGKAMFETLDEDSKKVANEIMDSCVAVVRRKAVDKE